MAEHQQEEEYDHPVGTPLRPEERRLGVSEPTVRGWRRGDVTGRGGDGAEGYRWMGGGGFSWQKGKHVEDSSGRRAEESGLGGRGPSWPLDEGARWAICTMRVKTGFDTKQAGKRNKDAGDPTDFQRKRSSFISTNNRPPSNPRELSSDTQSDGSGRGMAAPPRGPPHERDPAHSCSAPPRPVGLKRRHTSVSGALLTNPAYHIPGPETTPLPCEETERGSRLRTNGSQTGSNQAGIGNLSGGGAGARTAPRPLLAQPSS